jgi:hypothetical protein
MKSNERAELDRLMASFKGTIKRCPPATPKAVKKIKRKARAASDGRLETAEATMRIESPPPEEAKDATKGGSGADLGGMTRFKEADYDGARGPRDHARRAFHMPKDYRSRGYIEMMVNAAVKDDVYEDFTGGLGKFDPYEREREQRFRSAAKKGTTCGACGNALDSKEPVWRVRRKYDGTKFEIEWDHGGGVLEADDVVAPICRPCWDKDHQSSRVAQTGPCSACGRTVHLRLSRHGCRTASASIAARIALGVLRSSVLPSRRHASSAASLSRPSDWMPVSAEPRAG